MNKDEESAKLFMYDLQKSTGIELSEATKTRIWKRIDKDSSTIIFNSIFDRLLTCVNNGDVLVLGCGWDERLKPIKFGFGAETFLINDNNGDYMKDIQVSQGGFIVFLTSAGNVFTYGRIKNGRCGINNENLDNMKQIEEYDKKEHGERLTIPYQLKGDRSKFITDVYVGYDFALCLDKKNLYCWGNNEFNVRIRY